ncbi:MAG: histidine phosphatase family protein, partial [Anaerolineae bacterium]|nr:histidine phosphatase family protein [Anaerolineae bacterium]
MHLYLIRHGQSVENTQPYDGRNDNSALTDLGQAQAAALATWLAQPTQRIKFNRLYSSPMQRAKQTAAAIAGALGMEVAFDSRLMEVGNCKPDGSPYPLD